MKVRVKCDCGHWAEKESGHLNRAKKLNAKIFCSQRCFGRSRRIKRTIKEKKAIKAAYDDQYHRRDYVKAKKAEYFKKDYTANPEKYRKWRKKRQKKHNEYCRQPEYRKWKKQYDQQRRAKIQYGDYSEAAIALYQLAAIVDNRKAKSDQDNLNKSKKRRKYGKTYSKKPQERVMAINTGR